MRQPGDRAPAPGALALVQDFVNTLDIEAGVDTLADAGALAAFCDAHGMRTGHLRADDVVACRELREAIRDACEAHVGVPVGRRSLTTLRRLLTRGSLVVDIDEDGDARVTPAGGPGTADGLVAAIAAAIVTATVEGTWTRLKACAAHQCRWVYYDRSPAGRSRWCTMSICGSRAKMRAYRRRPGQ